jgi:site-specific DNA-methyltransferase (adenine-specific)
MQSTTIGCCELILADSQTMLAEERLPPFDALLTDPPYGIGYESRHNTRRFDPNNPWTLYLRQENFRPIAGDDAPFDPRPWLALAGERPVCLWGANHYHHHLPPGGRWLVWDKREGNRPNRQADCEMAWTGTPGQTRLYSHLWSGLLRRGEENLSSGAVKLHPHQKPVAVMSWMLSECGIRPGMTVLDPYMGSGSLGVACLRRGIGYVGIEIDPEHYTVACQRLSREARQPISEDAQPWETQRSLFA